MFRLFQFLFGKRKANRGFVIAVGTPRNRGRWFPDRDSAERAAVNEYERNTIYALGPDNYLYLNEYCDQLAPGFLILGQEGRGSLYYRIVGGIGEVVGVQAA